MKMFTVFLFTFLMASSVVFAQNVTDAIDFEIPANEIETGQQFTIKNINGSVKVTGHNEQQIIIEGTRYLWKERGDISASDSEKVQLITRKHQGNWFAYIDAPGTHPEFEDGKLEYHMHWDDHDEENRIRFSYDLEIKIPVNMSVEASTINSGDLEIEAINGWVSARNVNGSVIIKDIKSLKRATTVNGDVKVWMNEKPVYGSDFKTVNGSIELYLPTQPDAIVEFESLHGELYTDFEEYKPLPARLDKKSNGDGSWYKINQNTRIQFGDGGPELKFKMVNGSAYIRQKKS